MIHRHVSHNGRLLPIEQARLSPSQEALINGWGLFTTLRVVDGQPFAFERHWRRLERDSERTHVPLPTGSRALLDDVLAVIRANQVKEGAVRVYIFWNRTGHWHGEEALPESDLLITSAPMPAHHEPLRLDLREHGRHAASPLAGVKTTSWLLNVWLAAEAKKGGFDEVILLNERGEVAECTSANVFAVRGGQALTPPLSSGCLAGITREVLLEIGPRAGVPVREAVLRPEDLYSADEVFVSSTIRAALAVGEIAGRTLARGPGPVSRKLSEAFAAYMAEYIAQAKAAAGRQVSA